MVTQDDAWKIARKLNAEVKTGRRHELVIFRYQGSYIAQFGISRGSRSQPHDYIPKQLFLTHKQCRELRDCPLTIEGYVEILADKGLLPKA
jgi:hypothetical protein